MSISFGKKLKTIRAERGWTQDDLASRLGTSKQVISRYENGQRSPKITVVQAYADVLGVSRSFLIDDGQLQVQPEPWRSELMPVSTKRLPFLGEIACGEPRFAQEEHECYVNLTGDLLCDFVLRAKGDSMVGARIHDGDLVFVRQQDDVLDGEIAVVILDDEATLKRVRRTGQYTLLLPENPRYEPIVIGGEDETRDARIIGKAVAFQGILR